MPRYYINFEVEDWDACGIDPFGTIIYRVKVFEGWLVRTGEEGSMVFIPDKNHQWGSPYV